MALEASALAEPAPLLEREAELEAMAAVVRRLGEGRGSLVLMEGPAGTGKTALLDELRAAAQADGVRVLSAHGTELGRDVPFGVVRHLLEPVVRHGGDQFSAGLAPLARPVFDAALGAGASGAAEPLVEGLVGIVANLVLGGD
ncbi:MAG: hypothetical protein QOF37_1642, partial [Thermoleophilaceae bacterium]|nr:hypothetical protein [Thermoleophilaceae bacterium]